MAPRFVDGLIGSFGRKDDVGSGAKFTEEFKRDAAAQVKDRGYPVREVAERLGVSTKTTCARQKLFSRPATVVTERANGANSIPPTRSHSCGHR